MKKKLYACAAGIVASWTIAASYASAAAYTVKPGDSLWSIATANNTTVQQLMAANQLKSSWIYPGQVLQIPDAYSTVYIAKDDDTMWKISQKFGVPLQALINANPQIKNPNNIWGGLTITIPAKPAAYLYGRFPLNKGTYQPFTDNYGDERTWSPDGQTSRGHTGVDIFADKGTPVYSVLDGKVVNFGWNEYGGWRITIQVDSSTAFYYAHMSKYAPGMKLGAQVKKGQLIGYVGNTGYGPVGTEGKFLPHLHFGIYKTNVSPWSTVDPYKYLRWWELNNG